MHFSPAELETILVALNDREGVLCTDWEAASRAKSNAQVESISAELRSLRALADKIASASIAAKRLASI